MVPKFIFTHNWDIIFYSKRYPNVSSKFSGKIFLNTILLSSLAIHSVAFAKNKIRLTAFCQCYLNFSALFDAFEDLTER